jgi:hypothetical protein
MIGVDYGVLNQKGSPSWFSDIYANIPTAGYKGRMFISIDTYAFYRDTGTGWDLIGGPGTGTITGSGTSGQVSYFNGSSTLAGSNNLFWDNTNGRLGIGTATPGAFLDIHGTGTNAQFNGTGTNNAYLVFQNAGTSKWRIGNNYNAGANSFDIYNNGLANTPLSINSATNLITLSANVTTTGIQAIQNGLNLGYASGGATASYTNMSGSTTGINFALANGTGGASFIFPTAAGYNYTFPATTGTLALTSNLSSYVPYTGATTNVDLGNNALISGAYININGAAGSGGVLNFKQYGASSINAGLGYTGIFALTTAYLGISYNQDGTNSKTFYFNGNSITNNVSRIYTMPNADGTLALTSDITGYLPLTGGTLTGNLTINPTNTAIVGLDVASNTTRFRSDNLEGSKRQLEIVMGSGTLVQLTAKGYGANYGTDMAFYTATTGGVNASPGIYITGTNNRVGIKTGTPSYDLDVTGTFGVSGASVLTGNVGIGGTATTKFELFGSSGNFQIATSGAEVFFTRDGNNDFLANGGTSAGIRFGGQQQLRFQTGSTLTTRMTIDVNGQISTSINQENNPFIITNVNASPYGPWFRFTTDINNSTNYYLYCGTDSTPRVKLLSNGGIANYAANNVVYSDRRLKKDIIPLESVWNKIKNIEIVKYKYKDQTHDDFNMGVIAQQVELFAPELIDLEGLGGLSEDGTPLKGIYESDINYYSIKVLQEAMAKIEELNEKLVRNNIN